MSRERTGTEGCPPIEEQDRRKGPASTWLWRQGQIELCCPTWPTCSEGGKIERSSDGTTYGHKQQADYRTNLPLCHAGEIAHRCRAAQNPHEFGVSRHLPLSQREVLTRCFRESYSRLEENR